MEMWVILIFLGAAVLDIRWCVRGWMEVLFERFDKLDKLVNELESQLLHEKQAQSVRDFSHP